MVQPARIDQTQRLSISGGKLPFPTCEFVMLRSIVKHPHSQVIGGLCFFEFY